MKKITIVLVAIVLAQSCTLTRAFMYYSPDITDHKIFPYIELTPEKSTFRFHNGNEEILKNHTIPVYPKGTSDTIIMSLDSYLEQKTSTTAFLVIRNDSVLFEKYYRGYTRDSISAVFSVSKSVTSLLTGIAVDEGYIGSIHDPVTKYVPELKKKDPKFERLTIEHLLSMRAGFKFNEDSYFPLSKATRIYYGTNMLKTIKRLRFTYESGENHSYQSIVTALLAVVVERATGKNLAEYLQEKVWAPLGMENRATWSIDDKRHRTTKGFCGLNTTAIDLAKIGRLYLNKGIWEGKQIVSADWVAKSATPDIANNGYQYQWWSYKVCLANNEDGTRYFADSASVLNRITKNPDNKYYTIWQDKSNGLWTNILYKDAFYALGIMNQVVYINPQKNIIVVRLGQLSDFGNYPHFIYKLADSL